LPAGGRSEIERGASDAALAEYSQWHTNGFELTAEIFLELDD